jgi:NADH-quinone oxidoreductase subunit C
MAEEAKPDEQSAGEKGHAAPAKPAGPAATAWESELVASLRQQFGSGIREASTYLGQNFLVVDVDVVEEVLLSLRDDGQFDYCVDVTAVHYPERQGQEFEVVYILYSFPRGERIRVKTPIAEGQSLPSAVPLWPTTNWLERECFDMFGIRFDGHPDMRRILLPEEWKGYPLRKDYSIIQQDNEWVQINLGIESGQ